jgi:hypothetical protein
MVETRACLRNAPVRERTVAGVRTDYGGRHPTPVAARPE